MNEKELSDRCREGDRSALSELYSLYAGRMLSVCIRYCSDSEKAKDMLQDGFVKVFRSFDKFRWKGEGSLGAWMRRIFMNQCLGQYRRKDVLRDCSNVAVLPVKYEPTVEEIDGIPEKVLLGFIGDLPEGTRLVFNMSVFEEMRPSEISAKLGIRPSSVTSQLSRAKARLAVMVRGYWNENAD
ncbi:MAG: sigma-70 family RNA polymerase sigma factor [Bacteroidales bacterium]|jgi:RNA polymerase sigma-70 factor (ECF subfamily)|nr:sigma-70 family RNA polymerase sigma factor [Bacteroidales bacterium]MCI2121518.1 sigma-70 family RNA polymerase sigma factor [Bacteroidales bacterium]MCI2145540.1 sigma-70 family RNA polymerase sigma factor [Bacteroidales bacterium]